MNATVDPVQNPQAYQRMLLDLVGNEDPAAVQHATSASLRKIIAEAGDNLRTRPATREWSVIELLGHMLDCRDRLVGAISVGHRREPPAARAV